jgi:hypothetical protein
MTKRDLPAAFYAAAGASELAYQRLRQLPDATERAWRTASETATILRERVAAGETGLPRERIAAEVARLRESAQRGAHTVMSSAATAQHKAVTGYRNLVAHGEKVVAARNEASTITVAPAEIDPPAGTAANARGTSPRRKSGSS